MSFVLDAQRRQDASADPDTAARQAYQEAAAGSGRSRWIVLALLIALTVAAAIAWWWWQQPEGQPQAAPATSAPRSVPGISPTATVKTAPAPQPEPTSPAATALPLGDRKALDAFSYSSHIYGSDKRGRRLVVDGQTLSIGAVHRGWRLEAIEEDGVIWESGNEQVFVPVLEMWGGP